MFYDTREQYLKHIATEAILGLYKKLELVYEVTVSPEDAREQAMIDTCDLCDISMTEFRLILEHGEYNFDEVFEFNDL